MRIFGTKIQRNNEIDKSFERIPKHPYFYITNQLLNVTIQVSGLIKKVSFSAHLPRFALLCSDDSVRGFRVTPPWADAEGASVATPMRASIGCDEGRFISPEECALAPSGLSAPRSLACEPFGRGRLPLSSIDNAKSRFSADAV